MGSNGFITTNYFPPNLEMTFSGWRHGAVPAPRRPVAIFSDSDGRREWLGLG